MIKSIRQTITAEKGVYYTDHYYRNKLPAFYLEISYSQSLLKFEVLYRSLFLKKISTTASCFLGRIYHVYIKSCIQCGGAYLFSKK